MTWNVKEDTVDDGRLLFRGFQRRRNRRKMLDGELDWLQDHQGEESLEGGLGNASLERMNRKSNLSPEHVNKGHCVNLGAILTDH